MSYKKHKQHRLPGYDYASSNDYFITINTKNKIHHFGEITNIPEGNVMHLSAIGKYLKQEILAIPVKYPGVELGEWTIMPNHAHLIITLPEQNLPDINQNAPRRVPTQTTSIETIISTEPKSTLQPLKKGSISSIMNHLSGAVTKWCKKNGHSDFKWQSLFHDHIIRNGESYDRISDYIANNVANWEKDCFR